MKEIIKPERRDIVVVPCWRRPEFLRICIERIEAALKEASIDYLICFSVDQDRYDPLILSVIRALIPDAILWSHQRPLGYSGGSYNILTGLQSARHLSRSTGAERIHVIEDDVFVSRDYFAWHEAVHNQYRPVVASACRNDNAKTEQDLIPNGAFDVYSHLSYQSLGVSMTPLAIDLIDPYLVESYFRNPIDFCRANFPFSDIPPGHAEQAGLIRRILCEENNISTMFPGKPRAYHAGFFGKNRSGSIPLAGGFEQRYHQLRNMSQDEMNHRAGEYVDIEQVAEEGYGKIDQLTYVSTRPEMTCT